MGAGSCHRENISSLQPPDRLLKCKWRALHSATVNSRVGVGQHCKTECNASGMRKRWEDVGGAGMEGVWWTCWSHVLCTCKILNKWKIVSPFIHQIHDHALIIRLCFFFLKKCLKFKNKISRRRTHLKSERLKCLFRRSWSLSGPLYAHCLPSSLAASLSLLHLTLFPPFYFFPTVSSFSHR